MKSDLIVGLDIGTTKVCAVVGEVADDRVNIVGLGSHPSVGLRKGVVVSIEETVDSIRRAVSEAELMAGCEITQVYAGSPEDTSRDSTASASLPSRTRR